MRIEVGNKVYEVDDNFGKLSSEEQDATLREITGQDQQHEEVKQETAKKEEAAAVPPNWYDVTNSQSGIRKYVIDPALASGSGVGDVAHVIGEHPLASGVAASYIPGVNKLPGIRDIKNTRELAEQVLKKGAGFAQNAMGGGQTTTAPGNTVNAPGSPNNPIGGKTSAPSTGARTVPVTGSVAPETVPINKTPGVPPADMYGRVEPTMGAQTAEGVAQGARTAAPAAAQGESMLSRFGNLASKYGSAIANNPIINNPVTRFVASKPVQGALLALHSGDLNAGEGQQIAQMKQWQDNFAKLPVAQQNAYYNLPHDKQIQVNAMIRSGQDPSSILGQNNAITSGYARQIQQKVR